MGECCIAGSRLLVDARIADAFQVRLAERLQSLRMGDPLDPSSRIGAIINQAQFDRISALVREGVRDGARIVCGGDPENHSGLYYPATVLADVKPGMAVAREEIFGPVVSVMQFENLDQAVSLANDTEYGLAAYVWTNDLSTALSCSRRIRAGRVWVNSALAGFPEMPLGGFKQSGNGRETGRYGVEEYTELKSVHLQVGLQSERWVEGA
jgi:betaine-aldehyde dehydrogenase